MQLCDVNRWPSDPCKNFLTPYQLVLLLPTQLIETELLIIRKGATLIKLTITHIPRSQLFSICTVGLVLIFLHIVISLEMIVSFSVFNLGSYVIDP